MTKQELGQIIKQRRITISMQQNKLAEYTGLSVMTISKIEVGKGNPSFETLSEICHFLNLEISISIKR